MDGVLHLIHSPKVGGVEAAAAHLREHCTAVHYELAALAPAPGRAPAPSRAPASARAGSPSGVSPVPGTDFCGSGLNDPRSAVAFWRYARAHRPRVLVTSLWRSVLVGLLSRPFLPGTRWVVYLHNSRWTSPVDRLVHAVALRRADAVFCDSRAALQALVPTTVARRVPVHIVRPSARPADGEAGNGAALPIGAAPAPDAVIRLLFWGRIAHQKRLDRAVRLLAALEAQQPGGATLTVIGPDEGEQAALEQLAKQLGVAALLTWHGAQDWEQIRLHAAASTFFVQLSEYEGLAMAVAEAMALGLVPVVTPVGEIPHRTHDGIDAVHAHPPLAVLAAQLREIAQDPERHHRMSAAAAAVAVPDFVEEFTRACEEVAAR